MSSNIFVVIDSNSFSLLTFAVVHPNTVGYPDPFWNDVPKIVVLSQQQWEDFDQTRILRQRERIAKGCCVLTILSFSLLWEFDRLALSTLFHMLIILWLSQLIGRRIFLVKRQNGKDCHFHLWVKFQPHTRVTEISSVINSEVKAIVPWPRQRREPMVFETCRMRSQAFLLMVLQREGRLTVRLTSNRRRRRRRKISLLKRL